MIEANRAENAEQKLKGRWWALLALAFCLLVISLDMTVLNVALPTLAKDLQATESQLQWMVDAYTLVYASLVLLGGSLGDRFGRKRMLLLGLLLFGAGSLWSAFSGNATLLVLARGFMGIGGALIMPGTLSLTANIFLGPERSRAIGVIQGVSGIGVVIGPLLGGFLLDHFSWGVIFLINVPIVLLAIPICMWLVPESKDPLASRLDLPGALLSIAGMFSLLFGIIEAPTYGLAEPRILVALLLALVLLTGFVLWERHTDTPMLDLSIFRQSAISASVLALTLASLGMTGGLFFLTQYLQLVLGYTPLVAGLSFTPLVLGLLIASIGLSSLLDRLIGAKLTITAGLIIVTGAIALLALLTTHTSYLETAGMLLMLGFGLGVTMVPATTAIMSTLPLNRAGVGSAATDTAQETGNALGVAIMGSILTAAYHASMDASPLVQALPSPIRTLVRDSLGGAMAVTAQLGAQGQAVASLAQTAFVQAIAPTVLIGAAISCCGALIALFFIPRRINRQTSADELEPVSETTAVSPEKEIQRA
ncbi:MAG TPA: MFS transporter [Ktedonobacteraceae bacterium]|nr:MFS transporter [Ktedonobacteraceae bacterium]